jgi:SAM-dependent methyltransferase
MKPHFNLLEVCVSNLGEILSGKKSADGVMFPVFSMELVEGIFKNNRLSDYFNNLTAKSVTDYIKLLKDKIKDRKIRVLEIGSGSAGTSVFVMEEMAKYDNIEFYFTDISKIFVRGGEKKFKEKYPFAVFKKLDIENDVFTQGFEPAGFDVVFASNVIHSTKDLRSTMTNTRNLLTNNGVFILNEVTETQDFLNLTFGLIDGWWKFEDTDLRLKNSPLLSIKLWEGFLKKSGFENVSLISTSHQDKPNSFSQSIFIAQKIITNDIKEFLELLYFEVKNNTINEKEFEKIIC